MQQENSNYSKKMKYSNSLYERDTLLKTAYTFTDRAYIHLEQDEDNWIVEMESKDAECFFYKEFENELIFQNTRKIVLKETGEIRKLLLARAMASTVIDTSFVQNCDNEEMSFDEKEILKSWYEHEV